ncbi:MAG: glycosyltransferase family 4 protein [Bacteroidales bacterium]|jgi:glycosyltransferase involved in cell wall biosynthesis|nr:glycosyltransferase family 4 protein [Bacteroidales bacterium]
MKVLMFGWEFPPHIAGGLGTACYGLTKGLTQHNVEVIFVMPKTFGDEDQSRIKIINASEVEFDARYWKEHLFEHQVSFIEINSQLVPYIGLDDYYHIINQLKSDVFQSAESGQKLRYQFSGRYSENLLVEVQNYALVAAELAHTQTFDIIHAHDWLTYKAGIAAQQISGKPLVVHVHATEFDRSGEHNINDIVYAMEREGMLAADAVCAVSDFTRHIIIEKYGVPEEKVFTLHNAVEFGNKEIKRTRPLKEKIVTFLGRVTFQKGPEYFVETAKKVLKYDNNVRFVMAGDGDQIQHIIEYAAESGIADKFHFTGFLQGDDIETLFGMSDVYVMPSISEPFGISPLEAMSAGVPVIISKQSGVSEILQYAIKVDFWDVDAMADAIWGILHYPALSEMFSACGKQEVHQLQWANTAARLKEIYKQLLHL